MNIPTFAKNILKEEAVDYTVFKIIPHTSNLNSTTRKFQSSMFELFSHKYPRYPWQRTTGFSVLSKDNMYVTVKDNPCLWWIVKMSTESNGLDTYLQKIEFLLGVPNDFCQAFKTKFHNHEQWKKATLEEVNEPLVFPSELNTDLFSLKYTRNNIFSLEFDYKEQNTPIRDLMTVSKELNVDETIYFYIQASSVPRKKWKALADYAWDQWDKGNVPSKPGINPKLLAQDVANLGIRGFYEAKGVADEVLAGIRVSFFNDKDKHVKTKPTFINAERQELLVNGDLSKRTKTKRNMPVFKTNIIYSVTSFDPVRRDMLSRSVANAFIDLNGDNSLKSTKISTGLKKEFENLRNWKVSSYYPNLMSVEELGKLQQLPTADIQREFEDSLEFNRRIETEVNAELINADGILAGYVTDRGVKQDIHIQRNNLDMSSTARAFIGSPRMGKDQAVINLVVESKLKHRMGSIVLDVINEQNGHRGMADAIRDHLPEEDIVDLNIMDTDNPIYLGLEPIVNLIPDTRIAADRVAEELCAFLLQDGDEDKLQTADHLREASKLANADILSIKHIFTSEVFRNALVEEKQDIFDCDIWEQYSAMSDGKQQAIYTPIMRRIGQIMNSEFLKPIFCQRPNPTLDLFKLIDEGKVIIFRMKAGIMSTRVIEILCYWIVLVCFMVKLAQDGKSKNNSGTLLILNEPHQYLTDGLAHFIERIFAEGPKYRLAPVLIFHNFKQFKKFSGFVDMMKSSSLNWHIFKNTNEEVYKELFGYLGRTFESPAQAFESTKRFQFIGVWLSSEGEYYDPFVADALPMIPDRYKTIDNSSLTLKHSKIYGRPINEVLAEIKRRNKEASTVPSETPKTGTKKFK
jgi:hypothetical protein